MRKVIIFAAGIAVGLAAASLAPVVSVRAQAVTPSQNGDVNGDGLLTIADAVYLLHWLFQGGPDPLPIPCDGPGEQKAKFRFLNDLVCQDAAFPAQLEACGGQATDSFDEGFTPTTCVEITSTPSCAVRLAAETEGCGAFDFCGNFNAAPNHVFDFVLTVVEGDRLALGYLVQPLLPSGDCPPFPDGGSFVGEILDACTPAAAQAPSGAGGATGFTGSGNWQR